jgi:hypothetical protein
MIMDKTRWPQWLQDAKISDDAQIEINAEGRVIWLNGTWHGGTWHGGTWMRGTWNGGTWHGGTWWSGIWNGGTWKNGIWKNGTWKNGIWKNGTWKNGTWWNGIWKDGYRRVRVSPKKSRISGVEAIPLETITSRVKEKGDT